VAGNRIVVGVDASTGARSALWWAADEARLRGSTLLVAHAHELDGARPRGAEVALGDQDHAGESLLTECAVAASDRQPGVLVTSMLSHSGAADALIKLSAEAELLVVGTRGRTGLVDTILGSVSHHVAAHAHCPVVVVAVASKVQPTSRTPGIVVAVSDAPESRLALEFSFVEARRRGVGITAVSGWLVPDDGSRMDPHQLAADWSRHLAWLLDEELLPMRRRFPEVDVTPVADDGGAADTLLREAVGAQLMVLGCEHSSAGWGNRLGPMPTAIVHRAPCPVVLIGSRQSTVEVRTAVG
jgi:nucleotide-binding universal stress UspA family protein